MTRLPTVSYSLKWQPPCEGFVKVNFDAYLGSDFHRGLGVVIRNEHGELLAAGSR